MRSIHEACAVRSSRQPLHAHGTAVGQVAQVSLELGETGDDLPVDSESGYLTGDPFFSLQGYFEDRLA